MKISAFPTHNSRFLIGPQVVKKCAKNKIKIKINKIKRVFFCFINIITTGLNCIGLIIKLNIINNYFIRDLAMRIKDFFCKKKRKKKKKYNFLSRP